MTQEILAFDTSEPNRWIDDNGNLHVKVSHLTKAQVRPYYGFEIPNSEQLRLKPEKIYRGYCPPEELSKPETIRSVQGIPIQLNHHRDYPKAPALDTRIGSTGDTAAWNPPYLDNSLHFTVQKAIDRINDGSMRELSLSYRYTPDFESGTTPDGEPYDFIMRDISANHVALVEEGRAGDDVLVADSALEKSAMADEKKPETANDDNPAVEEKETALADTISKAAEEIKNLHTTDEKGNVVDKTDDETNANDDDKGAEIKKILDSLKEKGLSDDDLAVLEGQLTDLVSAAPDAGETGDEDPAGDQPPESAADDEDKDDGADGDDLIGDALKACGLDEAPEAVQKAFAEGVRFGEKKEKAEPEKLDEEHESEGEEKALGEDAALKKLEKQIFRRIRAAYNAAEECKESIGRVRPEAFDSADDIYLEAPKREGVNVRNIKPESARSAYTAFIEGKKKGASREANDAAPKKPESTGRLNALFNKIHKEQ